MTFHIITIFPKMFNSYFQEGIIKRAQDKGLIKIKIHNLRDFTFDNHKTVDDRPYGGGPGMILKIDPIYRAIFKNKEIKITPKTKIILFSAKGKKYNQKTAGKFSKLKEIIMICGRYEGVDERVNNYIANEEISIGDYILTGGELASMIIIDSVSRLVPNVIKKESLKEESFISINKKKTLSHEYPQYTRPEFFSPDKKIKWKTPKVLLSGDHKKITEWKIKHSK